MFLCALRLLFLMFIDRHPIPSYVSFLLAFLLLYNISAFLPAYVFIEGCAEFNYRVYIGLICCFFLLWTWNALAFRKIIRKGMIPYANGRALLKLVATYLFYECVTVAALLDMPSDFAFVLVAWRESPAHGRVSLVFFVLSLLPKMIIAVYAVCRLCKGPVLSHHCYGVVLQSELRSSAWLYLMSFKYRIDKPFPTLELWHLLLLSFYHLFLEDIPQAAIQLHFLYSVEKCNSFYVSASICVGIFFSVVLFARTGRTDLGLQAEEQTDSDCRERRSESASYFSGDYQKGLPAHCRGLLNHDVAA